MLDGYIYFTKTYRKNTFFSEQEKKIISVEGLEYVDITFGLKVTTRKSCKQISLKHFKFTLKNMCFFHVFVLKIMCEPNMANPVHVYISHC